MVEIVKYGSTGRRKCAIARVNIMPGTGKITVNKKPFEVYFPRESDRISILEPLQKTNTMNKFNIDAQVNGGGITGQAGALRLGLSRALSLSEDDNRKVLRKANLLTRDPRMKERKKPGQKGARKRFQWVKR
jgi:small subunit ribosomal protein S9